MSTSQAPSTTHTARRKPRPNRLKDGGPAPLDASILDEARDEFDLIQQVAPKGRFVHY